ncbi:MAG: ankyrin repeat domain-containing protein [Planctomycetota bacterium]
MDFNNLKFPLPAPTLCLAISFIFLLGCPAKTQKTPLVESGVDPMRGLPVSMNGEVNPCRPDNWQGNNTFSDIYWHDCFAFLDIDHKPKLALPVFDDDRLTQLCRAIQANDLVAMKEVIQQGVDLDSASREGWTPLYWAFHFDDDPRPFGCLLDHGANPNIPVTPTRPAKGRPVPLDVFSGASVSHLVAMTRYNRMFEKLFSDKGNPNVAWQDRNENRIRTPFSLLKVRSADIVERFSLLLTVGADIRQWQDPRYVLHFCQRRLVSII